MNGIGGKFLKFILFIVAFVVIVRYSLSHDMSFGSAVVAALIVSCFAYIMMTLFGLILVLSGNYFIAIIVSLGVMFFGLFKLDEIAKSISWMTDDISAVLLCLVAFILMARDILIIIGSMRNSGGGEAGPGQSA